MNKLGNNMHKQYTNDDLLPCVNHYFHISLSLSTLRVRKGFYNSLIKMMRIILNIRFHFYQMVYIIYIPQELLRSTSKNTLRSEEADTGGVDGVFGEVGADTVDSSSVSAIRLKLILHGSLSNGVGWPRKVPEVEPCRPVLGLIPGDFKEKVDFLG